MVQNGSFSHVAAQHVFDLPVFSFTAPVSACENGDVIDGRAIMDPIFHFSPRIRCLPVVHGSGDFAVEVRRIILSQSFDCVAVPLPPSFRESVEKGIEHLPNITIAVQKENSSYSEQEWSDSNDEPEQELTCSYVPIDPCQPVIAAIRLAIQEHIPREYLDLEVEDYESLGAFLPDPYAIKQLPLEKFATAVLTAAPAPGRQQHRDRLQQMGARLRDLEKKYSSILVIASMADWAWLREAYLRPAEELPEDHEVEETELHRVHPSTLIFMLEELPFLTGLYEKIRFSLDSDENLSIDGVKELFLTARDHYQKELKNRGRKITPQLLSICMKYIRNLCLVEGRMTPDLYTLITAAKQIAGDQFAISVAEIAREYPFRDWLPYGDVQMSIHRSLLPDGSIAHMKNRLMGHPVFWRSCELKPRAPEIDKKQWAMRWNPFYHCSWPPEDVAIERFRTHVKDRALSMLGNDLAKVEKFTTSLKDGLDIRETLRNWHTGELYVKEQPPSRGSLDCVIMLFDSPADPRDYPWRITWQAEHQDESTLSFFATDFQSDVIGPGIAAATYGGAMFLFPPRPVSDIWQDHRFDMVDTLEERLLLAACNYSQEKHIAILSIAPPGVAWRRIAKRYRKMLVHVPLAHFSQETVQQLRMFHVLNGHEVRSYAEHFIRKA